MGVLDGIKAISAQLSWKRENQENVNWKKGYWDKGKLGKRGIEKKKQKKLWEMKISEKRF